MALPTYGTPGAAVANVTGVSPAMPTHAAGDYLFLVCQSANEAVTLSTPSGFAEVTAVSPTGTGTGAAAGATRLTLFGLRATSNAMAAPIVADAGDHVRAQIYVFSGCHMVGDPFNATAGDVEASATTAVTAPGLTTTVQDCLIVVLIAHGTDITTAQVSGYTNASLAGTSERTDAGTAQGVGGGWSLWTGEKAVPGAVSATTATLATASAQARMVLALMPPQQPRFRIVGVV